MKKYSVIYSWAISYILLLNVMVILSLCMDQLATKKMVEEYKGITGTLLQQVSDSIDSFYAKMQKSAVEICSDSTVISYALSTQPEGANYYNTVLLQERLFNQTLMEKDERKAYLYLKNINKVISPGTVYSRDTFYNELRDRFGIDEDSFEAMLSQRYLNQLETFESKNGNGKTVVMLTSIPMEGSAVRGVYVQVVEEQMLERILENAAVLEDSTTILMNRENEILCSNGASEVTEHIFSVDLDIADSSEIDINGEKYWIDWKSMKEEDWKLVTLIPMRTIIGKTKWISGIILPVLGAALVVGIALSAVSVYVNYRPLRELSGVLPESAEKNEYERINVAFRDMNEDIESMRLLQNEQAELLRLEFLGSCMENSVYLNESSMQKIIERLGVQLPTESFLVGLFDISTGDSEQQLAMSDAMVVLDELLNASEFSAYGKFLLMIRREQAVLLFYLAKEKKEAELRGLLKVKLQHLANYYQWELIYAFSLLHTGISELHLAYLEACELLDYKHLKNSPETQEGGLETELPAEYGRIRYSGVQEELLMRYALAGNREDALELLKLICTHNFEEQRLAFPVMRCLMEDVAIGMMKALSQAGYLDEELMQRLNCALEQIHRINSREQLTGYVRDLVLCGSGNGNQYGA